MNINSIIWGAEAAVCHIKSHLRGLEKKPDQADTADELERVIALADTGIIEWKRARAKATALLVKHRAEASSRKLCAATSRLAGVLR